MFSCVSKIAILPGLKNTTELIFDKYWIVELLATLVYGSVLFLKGNIPLLTGTLSFLLPPLGGSGQGYKKDISIQRGVAIKCLLYIYLIFITIIYGCINLTFTVLPLHIRNLTYLKWIIQM